MIFAMANLGDGGPEPNNNNNNNNTSICKAHNVSIRAESEAPKNARMMGSPFVGYRWNVLQLYAYTPIICNPGAIFELLRIRVVPSSTGRRLVAD